MHRLVQFHAIEQARSSLSTVDRQSRSYGEIVNGLVHPPDTGTLEPARLTALCEVLAQHTNTKDSCFFCIWEGHGWLPDMRTSQLPDVLENLPKIDLPLRRYYLFEGPLHAASQFCWTLTETCFVPASPNLFWPADHAWCVASEIDLYCTLIAGSEALAEALLADARLETWRVYPGDSVTYDSDGINTD
jgi:hypothetical protein